eukprot:GHVU01143133.1.p1 GENE.GHVU01143133.1~~GHVU01143133.1.p1  ORF type:complete len:160 (+),score=21.84 GHVU01143133.1:1174-1653(+)
MVRFICGWIKAFKTKFSFLKTPIRFGPRAGEGLVRNGTVPSNICDLADDEPLDSAEETELDYMSAVFLVTSLHLEEGIPVVAAETYVNHQEDDQEDQEDQEDTVDDLFNRKVKTGMIGTASTHDGDSCSSGSQSSCCIEELDERNADNFFEPSQQAIQC